MRLTRLVAELGMRFRKSYGAGLQKTVATGFTLVEILVAMALMGFVSLSIANFLVKSNITSNSLQIRYKQAAEIHNLIYDWRSDLRQGAYISDNSNDIRLEYTTYDGSGNASKKIYSVCYYGSSPSASDTTCPTSSTGNTNQYLKLSTDGGTTWSSPYLASSYTRYQLIGTPRFLYASAANDCRDFVDDNGNGVRGSGDSTVNNVATCPGSNFSTNFAVPSQSFKIALDGFQFSAGSGMPVPMRTVIPDMYLTVRPGLVRSTAAAVSPATKDSPLVQQWDTSTANSLFNTSFDVRGLSWDAVRGRLMVVGRHGATAGARIYATERNGVIIGQTLGTVLADASIQLDSVALGVNNRNVLALDATNKKLYIFNDTADAPLNSINTLNLASPSNLINNPTGIAFDSSTPDDVYLVGTDPADNGLKIWERNKLSGTLVAGPWTLPAAFDGTHPPSGMFIEATTGDFVVVRNYVNGSAPNQTIDIYRVPRSGTVTSFSVNISDLGSSATGITGHWGIAYDPALNRIFLSDTATDKVYEVVPGVIIAPRS